MIEYYHVWVFLLLVGILYSFRRRTGEIYKANKHFSKLFKRSNEVLMKSKIYELMDEESCVNYWERYSSIAFDAGQKAVLTSCVLTFTNDESIPCSFSFTVRRDQNLIPLLIIGHFLPCEANLLNNK